MKTTTDLTAYKYQTYLELCLTLVEEACHECEHGNYELAYSQLHDILETFTKDSPIGEHKNFTNNILAFPDTKH